MSATAETQRHDAFIEHIAAWRAKARRIRYTVYFLIAALVAWSIEAIVVGDTDWNRISWSSMAASAARFLAVDFSIVGSLMEPALETALMATLGKIGRAHV